MILDIITLWFYQVELFIVNHLSGIDMDSKEHPNLNTSSSIRLISQKTRWQNDLCCGLNQLLQPWTPLKT